MLKKMYQDRITDMYHLPSDIRQDDRLIVHISKKHI
jgi:hypothetical protein